MCVRSRRSPPTGVGQRPCRPPLLRLPPHDHQHQAMGGRTQERRPLPVQPTLGSKDIRKGRERTISRLQAVRKSRYARSHAARHLPEATGGPPRGPRCRGTKPRQAASWPIVTLSQKKKNREKKSRGESGLPEKVRPPPLVASPTTPPRHMKLQLSHRPSPGPSMASFAMAGLLPSTDDPAHFRRRVWETGLDAV